MPENVSPLHLILTADPALFAIVWLSLMVSISATLFAALIGLPLGALIALTRFRGRELAGFGRAAAEVGAIIIVGGNIEGFTGTMTTAIALETSKGDLPLAVSLGIVLIAIVISINALTWGARRAGERFAG